MKTFFVFMMAWGLMACAHAQSVLIQGSNQQEIRIEQALQGVKPGTIVIVGENHDLKGHQQKELSVMQTLRNQGLNVAVGMEFLQYPFQSFVDQYRSGLISETEFLKQVKWGADPYELYRDQILFADHTKNAQTVALNAPKDLTKRIAQVGLENLVDSEKALLPPNFTLGNSSYKQRFLDLMGGGHVSDPSVMDRYFAAQSVWDETMAWQASNYMNANPDQVMVIVVGEFHVQYGGGLPDRLNARYHGPIVTVSLVNTLDMSADEVKSEITPSDKYGIRSDYIWYGPDKN